MRTMLGHQPRSRLQLIPLNTFNVSNGPHTDTAGQPLGNIERPTQQAPIGVDMQYVGDHARASWNCQALFARRSRRHHPKLRHVQRLAVQHFFFALQETHSTRGAASVLRLERGLRAFWSHGTTALAGVGLISKDTFLDKFSPIN